MTACNNFRRKRTVTSRNGGFTLIEVLVALGIFVVLMTIVFVPLTQASRFLSVGQTQVRLQQSANETMVRLQRDLQRAIYVYPNDILPGVTDSAPYNGQAPYYRGTTRDVTTGNTSRIDILLPELNPNGSVIYPIKPAKYIVTYYARRLVPIDKDGNDVPWDVHTNPIVLFRAQYPYRDSNENTFQVSGEVNADTSTTRYTSGTARGVKWLTADPATDEFNLDQRKADDETDLAQVVAQDAITASGTVSASHEVVTPRNVQLVLPTDGASATPNLPVGGKYKPTTSFTCQDTNGDGKIDQVAVNLTLMEYNPHVGTNTNPSMSANVNFQKFTLNQTISLPNIR